MALCTSLVVGKNGSVVSNSVFALLVVTFAGFSTLLTGSVQAAQVAHWQFEGDFQDSSGNGNHLTPINSPTFIPAIAPFGTQAVELVASSSQYGVNTSPNGLDFTTSYSVSGWVKAPLQGSSGHRGIFRRGTSGSRADLEIYVQNGASPANQLVVAHNRNSGVSQAFDFTSFTPMPNDVTYHLTVTYDGTVARAYYDGVEQAFIQGYDNVTPAILPNFTPGNNVLAQPLLSPSYQVRVGSVPDLSSFFTGDLDEFQVFDTVLNQIEINNLILFNATEPPPIPEPATGWMLGLGGLLMLRRAGRRQS